MSDAPPLAAPTPETGIGLPMHSATDTAQANLITAQRVAVKRRMQDIIQEVKILAAEASDNWVYSIPYWDAKKGQTVYVEGPTIKCAYAIQGLYGNCVSEAFPAQDHPTHWIFMARFVDLERGSTVIRSFRQRKSQKTGMEKKDPGRAEDLLFQVGQSKAVRNAIVGALATLSDIAVDAAKNSMVAKIEGNEDQVRKKIATGCEQMEIPLINVERITGATLADMSARQLAKVITQLTAVVDGMAFADEMFPEPNTDESDDAAQANKEAEPKKAAKPRAAKKKKDDPPKEEPKADVQEEPTPAAADPEVAADGVDPAPETREPEAPAPQEAEPAPAVDQGGEEAPDELVFE